MTGRGELRPISVNPRGQEHRHGPGEYGSSSYARGLQGGHVDRMTLDSGRTVLAGELDSGLEQR
jgi:hypothetical protein